MHQLAFLRVLVGGEAADGAGAARTLERSLIQAALGRQRRHQRIAAMIVAVGELGARVARQAHDDAIEGHGMRSVLLENQCDRKSEGAFWAFRKARVVPPKMYSCSLG